MPAEAREQPGRLSARAGAWRILRQGLACRAAGILPRSLLGRMLLLALTAVLLAQALSSMIWVAQLRDSQMQGMLASARSLGQSMAASVGYFRSLPVGYRPLVLDQLRAMGGTRFFVSLNDQPLAMAAVPDTPRKVAVLNEVRGVLEERLGQDVELSVSFVRPQDLRLFNGGLKLDELPRSWAHYALTLEPVDPPVLVTQIHIERDEWLYLASLLPAPYMNLEEPSVPRSQLFSMLMTSLFLLLFIGLLVRWQSRPLKRLARAARESSLGDDLPLLPETGSSEVADVSRAFNSMRQRIGRYLNERARLFSAISHDLRTPITRLRLRVELLEDPLLQHKFERDLDELELLVKGALQCVKDTDIHENIERVDLNHLLECLSEPYRAPAGDGRVTLQGRAVAAYRGKPLALRRCVGNLLDNALKYGLRAQVRIEDDGHDFIVHFEDDGPGVPEDRLEHVFEPHFRLGGAQQGYGLGLGIARNIARAHGGEVRLRNRAAGGLQATLTLPRENADAIM